MRGLARYLAKRIPILLITVLIATYATVLIANMGGYVDRILRTQIEWEVSQELARNPSFRALPEEQQEKLRQELIEARIKAAGLDKPFLERSLIYLVQALSLDLGRAMFLRSAGGSSRVRDIILERLPWSVLLFTVGTVVSAGLGIFIGLQMGQKALSKFDRLMTVFAIITTVIPPWFIGIFFLLIFAFQLGILPSGGIVSKPHENPLEFLADFLWHSILPLFTWVFTYFGYWAYVTRNLVIQILHEDYVTAARAKGLPENLVMRRYVLRPAAPPIITMVALAVIMSWMGAIITETVFSWPGLGTLYWEAIGAMDAPLINRRERDLRVLARDNRPAVGHSVRDTRSQDQAGVIE